MPGKEITTSTGSTALPDLSLLKAHKALPKRRPIPSDIGPASATAQEARKHDLEREGYSSSERIRSWIPEPSSIQPVPDHGLPLTPPLNATEKLNGIKHHESPPNGLSGTHLSTHTASSGIATPVLKRSPPTPETTPPKLDQQPHISCESPHPRLPSTRAESFETARENQISDEDMSQPESPSLRPSRQKWLRNAGHAGSRSIGLGLGLESEEGERTPTKVAPKPSPKHEDLISFDGAWNGATPEIEAVRGGVDLSYRSELRKRLPKKSQISDHLLETPLVNEKSTPSPMTPLSLEQRVDQNWQNLPRASTEDSAEKIRWSLQDDPRDLDDKLREVDNRRVSQISATSTTVEAAIFSTPPRRRKTLRHSSKFTNLNSASIESERRPHNLNDHGHQRLLRHAKSPNGGQRASFVSDTYGADNILPSTRGQEVIPVFIVPQCTSSLGSKLPFVASLRRMQTLTVAGL